MLSLLNGPKVDKSFSPIPTMEQQTQPIQSLEPLPPPSQRYVSMAEDRSLNFLNPKLWSAMKVVAETFVQAGALPQNMTAPKLLMVLQAGYEAGLQPVEAIKSFYFVNGTIALYGEMAIAMVLRAGHTIEWGECDATKATITITRKDNGLKMSNTLTSEMVKARGLTSAILAKYPENYYKWKVFHMTARFVCPDALHNMPVGEVLDENEVITATVSQETAPEASTRTVENTVVMHKSLSETLAEAKDPKAKEDKKSRGKKKTEDVVSDGTDPETRVTEVIGKMVDANLAAEVMPPLTGHKPDGAPEAETAPGAVVAPEHVEEVVAPKVESEAERCERLIYEEIEGRKLTPREIMEINAYRAKQENAK